MSKNEKMESLNRCITASDGIWLSVTQSQRDAE